MTIECLFYGNLSLHFLSLSSRRREMLIWTCIVITITGFVHASSATIVDQSNDDFRFVAYHGKFIAQKIASLGCFIVHTLFALSSF